MSLKIEVENIVQEFLLQRVRNLKGYEKYHDFYIKMKLIDGKLYYPNYTYESSMTDNPILESYHDHSYYVMPDPLELKEELAKLGIHFPIAKKDDDVYCRCMNNKFTFSYGSYELIVKCCNCGNEWSAYSG